MSRTRRIQRLEEDLGDLLERHGTPSNRSSFEAYENDPVGFIRDVLGENPWSRQVEIAESVRDSPLVVVRSANAAGKDWITARLALWWAYAQRGMVLLTGPTERQVLEVLMSEVREAFSRGRDLPGELYTKALRIGPGKPAILPMTSTEASRLTGFHEERVLFCLTEAQGVEPYAFDAAFACATGAEDRILAVGNPLNPSGRFYRASRSNDWRSIRIPASDVPNMREGRTVIPGLITREGVDRIASEYGTNSGYYTARVRAEFPKEAEEGLFTQEWLEEAADRWESDSLASEAEDSSPICALDPARFGPDASVLAVRRGPVLSELVVWLGRTNTMRLAETVAETLEDRGVTPAPSRNKRRRKRYNPPSKRPRASGRVIVDEVGVGGGVLDRLDQMGFKVQGFNGGKSPRDGTRFFNRRSEAYWTLRERLERGEIAFPRDEEMFEELLALRWRPTPSGLVQLEAKSDLKSRIGRSPDHADAVSMAFVRARSTRITWGR